jgi:hypothetical protein
MPRTFVAPHATSPQPKFAHCVELKSRPSGNMRQRVWNGVRLALTHRSTAETTLIELVKQR